MSASGRFKIGSGNIDSIVDPLLKSANFDYIMFEKLYPGHFLKFKEQKQRSRNKG
jgi:hypothetical protein